VRGVATWGENMAVRILLVLAVAALFYGCGQMGSSLEQGLEQGKKARDAGPKNATPSESAQQPRSATPSTSGEHLKSTTPVGPDQQLVFGIRDIGLYAMDPTSSKPTRLTDGVSPAWSPDGKQIAYTKYLKEPNPEASSSAPSSATPEPFIETPYIFVMRADGSGGRRLLDKPSVDPAWSPDGKEIAFSLYSPGKRYKGAGYTYCGISIMDADGSGAPRELATGAGCASSPAWSPDGKQIAYTNGEGLDESGGSTTSDVYVVNAPGGDADTDQPRVLQPRALTDYTSGSAGEPDWSPDGKHIAFTHADAAGLGGIYKMDSDGSGVTPIARSRHWKRPEGASEVEVADGKGAPVWSPDGKKIAYVRLVPDCTAGCGGGYSLYAQEVHIMNSDGSGPTLLKDFGRGRDAWGLDWRALP
jgi:Tol biopolymer transport system component